MKHAYSSFLRVIAVQACKRHLLAANGIFIHVNGLKLYGIGPVGPLEGEYGRQLLQIRVNACVDTIREALRNLGMRVVVGRDPRTLVSSIWIRPLHAPKVACELPRRERVSLLSQPVRDALNEIGSLQSGMQSQIANKVLPKRFTSRPVDGSAHMIFQDLETGRECKLGLCDAFGARDILIAFFGDNNNV